MMKRVLIVVECPEDQPFEDIEKRVNASLGRVCLIMPSWKVDMVTGISDDDYAIIERALSC